MPQRIMAALSAALRVVQDGWTPGLSHAVK